MSSITTPRIDSDLPLAEVPGPQRRPLPPEITATVLAVSAVVTGTLLSIPVYGVFLGWGASALMARGSGDAVRLRVLARCLALGGMFGAATLAAQSLLTGLWPGLAPWVAAGLAFAVANPAMIAIGRVPAFAAVPGMFVGFTTLLAVQVDRSSSGSGVIVGSLVVALVTNMVGIGFHLLSTRLSARRAATTTAGPTRITAGSRVCPPAPAEHESLS